MHKKLNPLTKEFLLPESIVSLFENSIPNLADFLTSIINISQADPPIHIDFEHVSDKFIRTTIAHVLRSAYTEGVSSTTAMTQALNTPTREPLETPWFMWQLNVIHQLMNWEEIQQWILWVSKQQGGTFSASKVVERILRRVQVELHILMLESYSDGVKRGFSQGKL